MMRVWDAPIRLFHWIITLLVVFSYITMRQGWLELHFLSGYTILALLLFRLVWGFVGSETARFGKFLKNPLEGLRHLGHIARREPDTEIGHNAAGGWMVLVLLLALLAQVTTGLFSNADGITDGPLAHHLSRAASDQATTIHGLIFYYGLLVLIGLHIVAVLAYALLKRQDLVRPMVTGRKRLPATMQQPRFVNPALAMGVLAISAVLVWLLVRFG